MLDLLKVIAQDDVIEIYERSNTHVLWSYKDAIKVHHSEIKNGPGNRDCVYVYGSLIYIDKAK